MSVGTRLRLTAWERDLLGAVEAQLSRARAWDLPSAQRREKANDRVKNLVATFGINSRYAGTICIDNDAAVAATRELLWTHQLRLTRAVAAVTARIALSSKAKACGCRKRGCLRCGGGYLSEHERVMKCRRLAVLTAELAAVKARRASRDYHVVLGGRKLANSRHHLDRSDLAAARWQADWQRGRAWLGSVGNAGVLGGNPCLSLRRDDPDRPGDWFLTVSVPRPVQARFGCGSQVRLASPVPLAHHRAELEDRLASRAAVRADVHFAVDARGRERAMLRLGWVRKAAAQGAGDGGDLTNPARSSVLTLQQARLGGVVAADLNADHLAAARVDQAGNPVGRPVRIPLKLKGLPAALRDARLREAITALIEFAHRTGARAIVVEELGFAQEKTREKHGRNKTFRATISGFPTLAFKTRLVAMCTTAGLTVITVDPRYTSKVGGRDWQRVLDGGARGAKATTATTATVGVAIAGAVAAATPTTKATRHEGAAVAIGRRGLALGLKAGKRTPGRAATPQNRPAPHQLGPLGSSPAGRRDGSTTNSTLTGAAGRVWSPGSSVSPTQRSRAGARATRRLPVVASASVPDVSALPSTFGQTLTPGRGSAGTTAGTGRTPRISTAVRTQPSG